jgi:D-alanine-D-alanine ligase
VPDVAVIFGGPSPEHDVSVLTGLQATRGLAASPGAVGGTGGSVRALFWSKTGEWFEVDATLEAEAFLEGVPRGAQKLQLTAGAGGGFSEPGGRLGKPRAIDIDAALVCCHGGPGEDGSLQAALDLAGIRYSGPTVAGAALGMDKMAFGAVVAAAGLPTLPRILVGSDGDPPPFDGPYIVKPRFGGSSIGIDVVEDFATAKARLSANPHLRFGAVLEPYRPDLTDLQVGVRTWPALELSAVERPIRTSADADILDYGDKYVAGEGMAGANRELPAMISAELEQGLRRAGESIAALAGVRGVARIDYLSDGERFVVNEINTIPGSLARYLWVAPPLPFATLLGDLLTEARQRPTHAYSAAGADGTVLRSAGSIAAKLG